MVPPFSSEKNDYSLAVDAALDAAEVCALGAGFGGDLLHALKGLQAFLTAGGKPGLLL